MKDTTLIDKPVAMVGVGTIGRSWAKVFIRAGLLTRLYDKNHAQLEQAMSWLENDLAQDITDGLINSDEKDGCLRLLSVHDDLQDALDGVGYVQESGPENLPLKQAMFAELDSTAPTDTILGSSTSGFDMTDIAQEIPGRWRCIVTHPTNPPHIAPAVEVVPGKDTDPAVVEATRSFMIRIGQVPVMMRRYIDGFILNRLQSALLREAIYLVSAGVADVDAVDAVIHDGLGLRWALMGPFGVANTNADGGVRQYFQRYGGYYQRVMNGLGPTPEFSPDQIERLGKATDEMVHGVPREEIRRWRDSMMREIRRLKNRMPPPWARES